MLVVAHDDKLPQEDRRVPPEPLLVRVDDVDIRQNLMEIPAHAIHLVGLLAGAVDRTGYPLDIVFHEGFERSGGTAVEIDAVSERDPYLALIGGSQDSDEVGIEKHFTKIRQFDSINPRVVVEQLLKVLVR